MADSRRHRGCRDRWGHRESWLKTVCWKWGQGRRTDGLYRYGSICMSTIQVEIARWAVMVTLIRSWSLRRSRADRGAIGKTSYLFAYFMDQHQKRMNLRVVIILRTVRLQTLAERQCLWCFSRASWLQEGAVTQLDQTTGIYCSVKWHGRRRVDISNRGQWHNRVTLMRVRWK